MLLEGKTAIVYGGSGAIGSAVAGAFAREGAQVHLAGRTVRGLEEVALRIRNEGGAAHVAQLDALDRTAVEDHAAAVVEASGGIDVAFNATSNEDVQGTPLVEMQFDDFLRSVTKSVTAQFVTATAVARQMVPHGHACALSRLLCHASRLGLNRSKGETWNPRTSSPSSPCSHS
jgi:NAD(P)-dependent dehydrogenase (short-subunit alcohol dehydrogenase family)